MLETLGQALIRRYQEDIVDALTYAVTAGTPNNNNNLQSLLAQTERLNLHDALARATAREFRKTQDDENARTTVFHAYLSAGYRP